MANIAVSNTFVNGTALDASPVNQNFSDIINGTSDGTRDISVASIACTTLTTTGTVIFGNASGDDVTFNGSIAATIPVKTNATFDFGSATLGMLSFFIGSSGAFTTALTSAATASYTVQFPATAPATGKMQRFTGTSASSFEFDDSPVVSITVADTPYTVASTARTILVSASGGAVTLNLITASGNTGRTWTVIRTDSVQANAVTLDPSGAQTIGGAATMVLRSQYESITFMSDGTNLVVLRRYIPSKWVAWTPNFTGFGTPSSVLAVSRRVGHNLEYRISLTCGTTTADQARVTLGFQGTDSNVTTEGSSVLPTVAVAGIITQNLNAATSIYSLVAPSLNYVLFGYQDGAHNGGTPATADAVFSAGTILTIMGSVPIVGWGVIMKTLTELLELVLGMAKSATWFILTLVVPVTAWFIVLRSDVAGLKKASAETEFRVTKIEEKDSKLYEEWNAKYEEWNAKHEEIIRSLGRIEGEVKRLK